LTACWKGKATALVEGLNPDVKKIWVFFTSWRRLGRAVVACLEGARHHPFFQHLRIDHFIAPDIAHTDDVTGLAVAQRFP